MFDDMKGFADQLFTAVVLIVCAGISAHICHGYGTRRAKETFIGLVLFLAVGTQMFHIINASININSNKFHLYNGQYRRLDCTRSAKGGKRPEDSTFHYDRNPCYCHVNASCVSKTTNEVVSTNATCPFTDDYYCRSPGGVEIEKYLWPLRDCSGGLGPQCTELAPCTPCSMSAIRAFGGTISEGRGRCRSCASDNIGDCRFVPGVGPYCFDSPTSKKAVPCTRCCTDNTPVIVNDVCY